jgi:pyruvate dehydrogenase E1 component
VTLAPEGGAHQSTVTAAVGLDLPDVTYAEPGFATEVEWLLCDGLDGLTDPDGESLYLRLSTWPVDQAPFGAALDRLGEEQLRADVLAGGYRLVDGPPDGRPGVTLVTTGAMATEAVAAAAELDGEGVTATVVMATSPDLLHRGWRGAFLPSVRTARLGDGACHLRTLVPAPERDRPVVSVHDAGPAALGWVGSALGTPQLTLGVDRFGESGTIPELHAAVGIDSDAIVNACLLSVVDEDL